MSIKYKLVKMTVQTLEVGQPPQTQAWLAARLEVAAHNGQTQLLPSFALTPQDAHTVIQQLQAALAHIQKIAQSTPPSQVH